MKRSVDDFIRNNLVRVFLVILFFFFIGFCLVVVWYFVFGEDYRVLQSNQTNMTNFLLESIERGLYETSDNVSDLGGTVLGVGVSLIVLSILSGIGVVVFKLVSKRVERRREA